MDIRLNKGWRASLFSVNRVSGKIGFWSITPEMVIGKDYRPSQLPSRHEAPGSIC
jgi:hypothetical protein